MNDLSHSSMSEIFLSESITNGLCHAMHVFTSMNENKVVLE